MFCVDEIDPIAIAEKELREKKIPFIIRRYLPDGTYEDWSVDELTIEQKRVFKNVTQKCNHRILEKRWKFMIDKIHIFFVKKINISDEIKGQINGCMDPKSVDCGIWKSKNQDVYGKFLHESDCLNMVILCRQKVFCGQNFLISDIKF